MSARYAFEDFWLAVKNLVFPQFCQACGLRLLTEENGYFCPSCWEQSPHITWPYCTVCGKPHQGAIGFDDPVPHPCADCRDLPFDKRGFRRIRGAVEYTDAAGAAIRLFKYRGKTRLAQPLADLMIAFAREYMEVEAYDYLVPVPLYPVRQRERGFNQALVLTERIAPCFPNALIDQTLIRIRPTKVQSRIRDPKERRANVRGAFQIRGPATHLQGATVLLIDDVITTSVTVAECARTLRRHGAGTVDGFAAALTVKQHTPPLGLDADAKPASRTGVFFP